MEAPTPLSPQEVTTFDERLQVQPGTGITDEDQKGRLIAYLIRNPTEARSLLPLNDRTLVSALNALVASSGV